MKTVVKMTPGQALEYAIGLHNAGNYSGAEEVCKGVLLHDRDDFAAHIGIGNAQVEQGKFYEALYHFTRADKIRPNNAMALTNRGVVLAELGDYEDALRDCRRAVQLNPRNDIVWNNLGNVLERVQRHDEALHAYEKALSINPNHDVSVYNKGISLRRLGRMEESLKVFDGAIAKNSENWEAIYNRGTVRLSLGNYLGGFSDYEARFRTKDHRKPLFGPFRQSRWKGEDISDKTLLIVAEQGIGDTIQFLRYVPMVVHFAKRVLLAVHRPVMSLCKFNGVETLIPGGEWPEFDVVVNLMSLPWLFKTTEETIPAPWAPIEANSRQNGRIGLCWSGNWFHTNDANRSIPLSIFKRVMDRQFSYVNLQKEIRQEDEAAFGDLIMERPSHQNFEETGKVIADLDLVISVDTSVAHMSASMGVPTWILLPEYMNDWRWMIGREDSPWYPSVRLFRQAKMGDWNSVIDRVRVESQLRFVKKAA